MGNRGQIRQVFQNIISNALKFSKTDQQPIITISCKRIKINLLIAKNNQKDHFA